MKLLRVTGATVLAVSLLAACASGGETENKDPDPVVTDDSQGDASEAQEAAVAAAEAYLSQYLDRPTAITVTEPLGADVPETGEIYFIQCGVPACAVLGDELQIATDLIGWDLKRVNGGLTPETIKDAYAQAANAHPVPSGVIGSGFNEEIFAAEAKMLKDKGVPVVSLSTNDPNPPTGNLAGSLGAGPDRNVVVGEILAAAIIRDSGGTANTVAVMSPSLESNIPLTQGFVDKHEELCPDCSVQKLEVAPDSIGTTLPEELTAYLQANPNVNYASVAFGDMGLGVPSALQAAGMEDRVRLVTDTPGTTVSTYMVEGKNFFAGAAYPGKEFIWIAVDIILRENLGLDTSASVESEILQWLLTPENLPSSTEEFPVVEDFREQFAALWGVS